MVTATNLRGGRRLGNNTSDASANLDQLNARSRQKIVALSAAKGLRSLLRGEPCLSRRQPRRPFALTQFVGNTGRPATHRTDFENPFKRGAGSMRGTTGRGSECSLGALIRPRRMTHEFLIDDAAIRGFERWPGLAVYKIRYQPGAQHRLASLIESHGLEQCLWVLDHLSEESAGRARVAFAAWCVDRGIRNFESTCQVDERTRDLVRAARRWVASPCREHKHAVVVASADLWRETRACTRIGSLLARAATLVMDESQSAAAMVRSAFAQQSTWAWQQELETQVSGLRNLLAGRDP